MKLTKKKFLFGVSASVVAGALYWKWIYDRDTSFPFSNLFEHGNVTHFFLQRNSEKNPYNTVIEEARCILKRYKNEIGTPGLVIGVSVNGETVWEEGKQKGIIASWRVWHLTYDTNGLLYV